MAIIVKRKEFSLPPAGSHHVNIIRIIDLGTQHETYKGKPKTNPKILIVFEYMKKFREDGKNEAISQEYSAVLGEKANFQKAFKTLKAELFTSKEFDISPLLGVACLINVEHSISQNGKEYAKVASVAPPIEDVPLVAPVSVPKIFDLSEPDWELFAEFSDFLKDKIRKSPEYAALDLPENAPPPLKAAEPQKQKMPLNEQIIGLLSDSLKAGATTLSFIAENYEMTEEQRLHFESLTA